MNKNTFIPDSSSLAVTSSLALLKSLVEAPLLLGDLPEAKPFPLQNLTPPLSADPLNFSQKLGHLYEDALAQLLNSSSDYEILAQNLQLQKDQHHTLGELDFLLRDHAQRQVIHLELATKFYLAVDSPAGLTLPGPDARDDYFKKLARLREHQLLLPTRFKKHLPLEFQDRPILTQHLVNGCLFDHIDSPIPATPAFLNPNCRRGKWLHQAQLPQHFSPSDQLHLVPKFLWPVPFHLLPPDLPLELFTPEKPITRCLMLRINDQATPYFITPSHYPSQTDSNLE